MGNFYVNFTIQSIDAAAVCDSLAAAHRTAIVVLDRKKKQVLVVDRVADEQDPSEINKLGRLLSKDERCSVLAVANEDDDVLRYWLFHEGKEVDSFDSGLQTCSEQKFTNRYGVPVVVRNYDPTRIESESWQPHARRKGERGGNVQAISDAFNAPSRADRVFLVLHKEYDFAIDQHRALCRALGLSSVLIGRNYEDVDSGGLPATIPPSAVRRVGFR